MPVAGDNFVILVYAPFWDTIINMFGVKSKKNFFLPNALTVKCEENGEENAIRTSYFKSQQSVN